MKKNDPASQTAPEPVPEPPVVRQFGVGIEGQEYIVLGPFMLNTKNGPLERIEKGQRVILSPKFAQELFYARRIVPVKIPETFTVIQGFRTAVDGCWLDLEVGDVVKLERTEALTFWRGGYVRPTKGGSDEG